MSKRVEEATQWVGTFWLQSSSDETRDGILQLQQAASSELVVEPPLYDNMEITNVEVAADGSTKSTISIAPDRGPQTLHGLLARDGKEPLPVSLLEAHAVHWADAKQTFAPIWSVIGGHIERSQPFRGVRVRVPRYGGPAGGPVSMETGGAVEVDGNNRWIQLVDLPPRSYRELDRTVVRPLCTLLTLATGRRMRPSEIEVSPYAGTWWPVYAASQTTDNLAPSSALVPTSDLSVDVLANWLDQSDTLGPLPASVASVFENDLSVDTQALILTSAMEGLHRAIHPDSLRFTPEHGELVRTAATEAVHAVDPDAVDAVAGFLSHVHEVSYARRVRDFARRAEQLVPGITGKSRRWQDLVYKVRNDYAHQPPTGWMEEADLDRVLTVVQSLRWVLRLLLLDQAGLPSGLLAARFTNSQSYNFFLSDAAEWRPDIYPNPTLMRD